MAKKQKKQDEFSELESKMLVATEDQLPLARRYLALADSYVTGSIVAGPDSIFVGRQREKSIHEANFLYSFALFKLENVKTFVDKGLVCIPDLSYLIGTAQEGIVNTGFLTFEYAMMKGARMLSYEVGLFTLSRAQRRAQEFGVPLPESEERVSDLQRIGVDRLLASAEKMVQKGRNLDDAIYRLDTAEKYGARLGVDISAVDGLRRQAYELRQNAAPK